MTDLRKAAEMALEDICGAKLCEVNSMSSRVEMLRLMDKAAKTLRQALAQPEQEPVAWVYNGILHEFDPSEFATSEVKPLYTAPPKRKPLTDEEIILIVAECAASHQHTDIHFARAIEAKLKEKNT